MGIILYLVTVVLRLIAFIAAFMVGLFKCFYKKQPLTGLKNLNAKFYKMAYAVDLQYNMICPEFFTLILIKKGVTPGHVFGITGETISCVIAANLAANNLSGFGRWLAKLLISFKDTAFTEVTGKK